MGVPGPGYLPFSPEEQVSYWRIRIKRKSRIVAAFGLVLSISLAFLGMNFLSNAMMPDANENALSVYGTYLAFFDGYFLLAFIWGWAFIKDIDFLRHMRWVAFLMLVPGGVVLFSAMVVYDIPFARGLIAVMPLMGLTVGMYSIAGWHISAVRPEKLAQLRRAAVVQLLWCLGIAGVFELGVIYQRWLAIAFIYPSLVLMGVLLTVEGSIVHNAVDEAMVAADPRMAVRPGPAKNDGGWNWTDILLPVIRLTRSATIVIAVSLLAMVPCIAVLASPAHLDIVYASGLHGGHINVTVVNRGGQAVDSVELWGDGNLVKKIGRIDSFGVWEGKDLDASPLTLTIMVGGKDVASRNVYYPPSCDTIWLAAALIAAGQLMPRRVRGKRREDGGSE